MWQRIENRKRLFLYGVLLTFFSLFSYKGIEEDWLTPIRFLLLCSFLVISSRHKSWKYADANFGKYIMLFMALPFLSMFMEYVYNGQSFLSSFPLYKNFLLWSFYFVLHELKVSQKVVIHVLTVLACIWCMIELVQQFSYPHYWFYTRGNGVDANGNATYIEIRSGIYRFMVEGYQFAMIMLFYYFQRFYNKPQVKYLFLMMVMLLGLYLYMTRQILFASLCSIVLLLIFAKNKTRWNKQVTLFTAVAILVLFLLSNIILGDELISSTKDQLNSLDDDIRYYSFIYFLFQWQDVWCFLFGNGLPVIGTNYYEQLQEYSNWGLYLVDVGLVGELQKYGILYILVFISFIVYFFKYIIRKNQFYLNAYFLSTIMMSIMIFPYRIGEEFIFYSLFLYLCDLSYKEESKA